MHKRITRGIAGAATAALALTAVAALGAAPAQAAGNRSLVKVLAADGVKFDNVGGDFDILEAAVLAVLDAKPDSPVGLLADGKTRLTAFLPTDRAFGHLAKTLTGSTPATEKKTVKALLGAVDVDTLETVLLYHVVAGKTLTSPKVLAADGAAVTTAQGGSFKVKVTKKGVILVDKDPDVRNPRAIPALLDINKGNKQVGHGIDRVLLPIDV